MSALVLFRSWRSVMGGAGALGLLFGTVVSLLNGASWSLLTPLSLVAGVGWSWAAAGVAMGVLATNARRAAAASVVFLVMAVWAYYAIDLANGVYRTLDRTDPAYMTDPAHARTITDWSSLFSDLVVWSLSAVLLGALLGLIGWGAHRRDLAGLLSRLVVPVGALAEMMMRLNAELVIQPRPVAVVTFTLVGVVAVITAGIFIAGHIGRWRAPAPPRHVG
ncbi:hypothetical protein DPM19_18480 [Actinomadura craniellae]|uniref:Uncharacterized protein n=1 Tax=Actinomadura craniellae TaxID=2231787 RepID=A0A365H3R4_9ACTN|nr:hypothetical protein [Actinomadura craniellae]RAY13656.1 hypothetical protein DPM19_18480 [Actinomadura craniellae]